ncbi:polysaccharide deacetylase family protein [Oxynema aestuarii]|uniref:Polysaccharide deacetylase family protein n=1 Tax=Oxynema aestuarii AP17 TaxID=2064643 RepID=A0A6H1TRZ2_9CYAN|nr:polysaccharide deacetylase family protein [Oxynema aestuarii]QIZ69364.1 polysaccharide deacetylase family protein [Oxynema aestuarii AP17]
MITIEIPDTYEPERRYILSVIFGEFLGLDTQIQVSDRQDTRILINDDSRELVIADGLFATPPKQWLQPASLPKQPLLIWNFANTGLSATTVSPDIPVIYGNEPNRSDFLQYTENKIYLGLDIFGSAFFMLTRYEEVVKPDRDQHDRFPATASLAYQENFLDRPIINEYLEILWACLTKLWPRLQRKPRQFQTYVSHDVDEPFRYAFMDSLQIARRCAGDILKRRAPLQAMENATRWFLVKAGKAEADPCNTFDLIMDISEKHNLKSAFYFITDRSAGILDGVYSINHSLIRQLLRKIHQHGHEIGLHTSYNTYQSPEQTKKELKILKQVCAEEGIEQDTWGGRQHYLRWETPTTFQNWANAGLDYDTTLSFADVTGFRCGVCYEFTTFNLKTRQPLKLKERPLVLMECTVLDQIYMNLGTEGGAALQVMKKYKHCCQLFNGDFTLLWHNSSLMQRREIELYQKMVSNCD